MLIREKEKIEGSYQLIRDFYQYAKDKLGFLDNPKVIFISNKTNAENPLGKTGFYDPGKRKICIYITQRHIKDIIRSLAHEMIHHDQNCRGEFDNVLSTNEGYAQKDSHLREMEREAYERGNLLFRDFEDGRRETSK